MNNALISELKQNTRLRIGVWLILAILAGYGLMLLDEERQSLAKEHESKLGHLTRLKGVVSQTQWTQRIQQINQVKVFFEEKLWRANTKGLAEADVQSWLDFRTKKLENSRVKVENAVDMDNQSNLWMVSADVRADFTPKAFQQLLYNLYFNQWLVVERSNVSNKGNKPRFSVGVRVYFQKPKE